MRNSALENKLIPGKSRTGLSCLLYLLICLVFSMNARAQSCTISQFVKSYESEGNSIGYFLGRFNSGGLYFGGSKEYHLVLHTTDVNGNPIWDKRYQCPAIPGFSSSAFATMDSSGNFFVSTDGTGIGLLDAGGNVLTSKLMNNIYPGMYCISIGVLADNKKILLLKDQMMRGGNGYEVVCLSPDLSTIVWTRYFTNYDCTFLTMDVLDNKVFVPGWVDGVATLLCFDGVSGNLLSTNSYKNGYNRTFFDKIYKYNDGYIVLGRRYNTLYTPQTLIMRLNNNLEVINSYLLNEVKQNVVPALAVEADGSYYGALGDVTTPGSYSFAMSKDDEVKWSLFNGSINFRPTVYCNMPEGLTLLSYGVSIASPPVKNLYLILSRTDEKGKLLNCPSSDFSLSKTSVDFEKSASSMIPVDTSFITLLPTAMLVSNDTYDLVEVCQNASTCNTVAIIGKTDLCNVGAAQFIARRNKECSVAVTWTINNNLAVQTLLNDSTLSIRFPGPGSYTLIATLPGCKLISDTVQINVTSVPVLDLGPDTTLCPGNKILLNARKGFSSYLWQNGSTDSVFTVSQPGEYFVTAIDACGGINRDTVMVNPHPPIPFYAGLDRIKCNNDTIQLHATPGFLNYQWLPDYHLNSTTSADVIANPLNDIAYTVKAEKTPGCFVYDTVYVTVNHSMPIHLGTDTSFCLGESVIFNAGNHFSSYTWSNGSHDPFLIVKTAGKYFVDALSTEGCHSFDTVQVVNVFSNPIVALDQNNSLCSGDTRLLNAGNFTSYLWNDGSNEKTLLINKPGTYYVSVTDENNCKGRDTTFITNLLPSPSGFLSRDTSICSYAPLLLTAKAGFATYLWSDHSSASSVTIDKPGVYWLQVTDNNHCVAKEWVTVSLIDCIQGFFIPNAFTPNNDGRNDIFKPLLFGKVISYRFIIYNRFGQKVFETTDLAKGWNGALNKSSQHGEAFVWICNYQLAGSAPEIKKGSVMLLR